MDIDLTIMKSKLDEIPLSFRLLAKEELQKELNQHNPFPVLDPDKIYVNIARETTVSSETLTESLLKKSIGAESLLSNNLAGMYSNATDVNTEVQIKGLNAADVKNSIDHLSAKLINTYYKQINDFWKTEKLSTPQELQVYSINSFLNTLEQNFSLVERAHQLDSSYPNLKQTVISYFCKKLKDLYGKDIHPDTIQVLLFKESDTHLPFLSFNLTNFILNYFLFYLLANTITIQIETNQDIKNVDPKDLLHASDILAIKSAYQIKLNGFWQKNFHNYRILAKFSYLRALLEQQNSEMKLSRKGFELALLAMGFSQEKIDMVNALDPKDIPLDILGKLSNPNHVEVSSFLFNNQASSDILKICDLETDDILLYIPGYAPSFIEAKDERLLIHWVYHQIELSPDNLAKIASHFPHAARMANNSKLDAFLYSDYVKQGNPIPITTQGDIFSFITERQQARMVADLYVLSIPMNFYPFFTSNNQSTDTSLFTTIVATIECLPYLPPNIYDISCDLHEFFPNPYKTAAELVKKSIKDTLALDIDPDKTFIQVSSSQVQSIGYDPMVPPILGGGSKKSIQSLTEAVLSNYRHESSFYGFTKTVIYQSLSGNAEYTADDQLLDILPHDIEIIIQEANLDTLHKNKLNAFWNTHADRMKYFIKQRYLQQILEEYQNNTLSEEDLKILLDVTLYSLSKEEDSSDFINSNISIEIISIAGYQSTDLFVFRNSDQKRVILYIPENTKTFFAFASYEKCICFLEENAKESPQWQELLLSHFSMDVQDLVLDALKQGPYIESSTLATAPYQRPTDCSFKNAFIKHPMTIKPMEKGLFEAIKKNIQERSYVDANTLITSNKEVLLERIHNMARFIGIAFLLPSLAFPILNWITLSALVTEASIELYIAKNGDTVKERHQAAIDAGVNSIGILIFAFLNFRSLKLSKNRRITNMSSRGAIGSRWGTQNVLKKEPLLEEIFFDTTKPMQVWNITASNSQFHHLDVKTWFLGEQFLLFTGKTNKADHLIISSHGGAFPKSGIVQVPTDTELVVLGPHGWILVDPQTANIAKGDILSYGVILKSIRKKTLQIINSLKFSHKFC